MSNLITPEQLRAQLRTVTISNKNFIIAEGDLLIPESGFADYAKERLADKPPAQSLETKSGGKTARLVAIADSNGQFVRWAPGIVLTYYIEKENFSDDEYAVVNESVLSATEDWMRTCGIEFQHFEALDKDVGARAQTSTVFSVSRIDVNGEFIAAAFFPNDPPERRKILIDPSFFAPANKMPFNRIGVLRHELGHVLGFRHEHILSGAPPACPKESLTDAIQLGAYDPKSVMHYFCGGVGDHEMKISSHDVEFSQMVYGPPLTNFALVRP